MTSKHVLSSVLVRFWSSETWEKFFFLESVLILSGLSVQAIPASAGVIGMIC